MPDDNKSQFFTLSPRRKTSNLVLQPHLQLKLPVYLLGLTFCFAVLFTLHGYVTYDRLYEIVLQHTDAPEYFERVIQAQTANFKAVSASMGIAYVLLMLTISILYTHRLVGPTVAFRRHVESIRNGDFSSRIVLRKNDAFLEVARELNELAEMLGEQEKPSLPPEA